MRKRKHHPATDQQRAIMQALLDQGATDRTNSVPASRVGSGSDSDANALNRLYSRGWAGRSDGRWWLTEKGALHLATAGSQAMDDAA